MLGGKARKAGFSRLAREDDGGLIHAVISTGNPMNGTATDDFMFGYAATSAVNNTMNGNDGNDFIIGDSSNFHAVLASTQNNNVLSPIDLDAVTSAWTEDENPLIRRFSTVPNPNVPSFPVATAHTTAYVEGTPGQQEWFAFTISGSSNVAIDVDYGDSAIGGTTNLVIELYNFNGSTLIATNDTSSAIDPGSHSTADPFILIDGFSTIAAGTYLIRISESGATPNFEGGETFLLHVSVEAADHATGAASPMGNDTLSGGDGIDELVGVGGNDVLDGGTGADLMIGGTGDDTYFVDNAGDEIVEAGQSSFFPGGSDTLRASASYVLAQGVGVETLHTTDSGGTTAIDLTGNAENQTITGNAGANTLRGEGGSDLLLGLGGNDTLIGGTEDDSYYVDAGDVVTEADGEGDDAVYAVSVSYALAAGASVETLTTLNGFETIALDLTGNEFAQRVLGNYGANILRGEGGDDNLFGYDGNDTLDGGTGADNMTGGTGDDIYVVNSGGDRVFESAGQGDDIVRASLSYTLAAGVSVELLETESQGGIFARNLTGNEFGQVVRGNNGGNILRGEGGNDNLFGFGGDDFLVGGASADLMVGGGGDDTYYIDDTSDAISEFAGQGNDRIAASITLALAADADIERLDVEALTSTNAIDLTGSAIANTIYGNDGVNILRGEAGNDELRGFGGNDFLVGGTGTDLMVGGTGNDTFYVDDASDAIGEIAGEGNDRIAASVSFVLSNGANVELLEAVNLLATTAFDLTGSDSANTITGNNGVNFLRGEGGNDILSSAGGDDFLVGGAGADQMTGGAGNDTYYVDAPVDAVFEVAGEGNADRVVVSVSFQLASGADIELLETATQSDTTGLNLTGSDTANTIRGNAGFNTLDGKGGSDTLDGGGGADTFRFTTALGPANVDTVVGFLSNSDKLALDDAIFTALAPGALAASAFRVNSAAQDADDRILYNSQTGQLYYDADGNGAGAAVQFATLQGAPSLVASDFTVI